MRLSYFWFSVSDCVWFRMADTCERNRDFLFCVSAVEFSGDVDPGPVFVSSFFVLGSVL